MQAAGWVWDEVEGVVTNPATGATIAVTPPPKPAGAAQAGAALLPPCPPLATNPPNPARAAQASAVESSSFPATVTLELFVVTPSLLGLKLGRACG
jgi:hypothetical protein